MMPVERRIITALIKSAVKAGFVPVRFWDEGDYQDVDCRASTTGAALKRCITSALSCVDSVDMGTLHFAPQANLEDWGTHGVLLILGNGQDVISDWHCQDVAFDAAVSTVADHSESFL
jgi:hypothetical protein